MAIWVNNMTSKASYEAFVKSFRKDREQYIESMVPGWADMVDNVMVLHEWPDEDGVFLLKDSSQSIAEAQSTLHPNARKFLEEAVKDYGDEEVGKNTVLLKMHPED